MISLPRYRCLCVNKKETPDGMQTFGKPFFRLVGVSKKQGTAAKVKIAAVPFIRHPALSEY